MTRTAEDIAADIRNWDLQDASDLRNMLTELQAACRDEDIDAQHVIDMTSLPSAPIPADVDVSYPVWSMDMEGRMLVGENADMIKTLESYRADRQ